jgi:hypothetical protein
VTPTTLLQTAADATLLQTAADATLLQTNATAVEELLRAVVTTVVCFLLFFTGLLLLRRVGLAPETELSSVHAPRRGGDRDTRDRIASLLFWVVLFGSLFVAFAVVDWLL